MQISNIKNLTLLIFYTVTIIFAYISVNSWLNSLTTDHGIISIDGQYVGRDFLFFYAAAKQAVAGNIHDLYTGNLINGIPSTLVPELGGEGINPQWPWLYPPHYLLLLAPFAALPYYFALATWLALSLLLPSIALWYYWRVRGLLWLAAILNINIFICLVMGQNSLIFSSIAGIGIASLKNRPILAGVCFSIMSMKPHFAILIPLALLLGRYWQALLYTILSTLCLMLVSSFAFGWDIWGLAFTHFNLVQNYSLSDNIWFFSIYSTYRALLGFGFSSHYAWMGQFLVASVALYGFQNIWRKNHSLATKWLAFGIAALLCTPYNLHYDAVWITLPMLVWSAVQITQNNKILTAVWILGAMQVFAFAVISMSNSLAILLIIGALLILLSLDKPVD